MLSRLLSSRILLLFLAGTLPACEQERRESSQVDSQVTKAALKVQEAGVEPKAAEVAQPTPPPWANRRVEGSGFPCELEEVLAGSCRRCHWEPQENDAPFPLKRWEDTRAERSDKPIHVLMGQMVSAELMPPLDATVSPKVDPLSPEQKEIILDWVEGGAKKSDAPCVRD